MTLLLQLGADVDCRVSNGGTAMTLMFSEGSFVEGGESQRVRLLLSWGMTFFPREEGCSREYCIYLAREGGAHEIVHLLESELGGRRCEIVNLSSRPELTARPVSRIKLTRTQPVQGDARNEKQGSFGHRP